MRAVQLLVAALILGLAGGYAWSAMVKPAPHLRIPKAVTPKLFDAPQSSSDREWAARALGSDDPTIDVDRDDPTKVEQSVHYAGCNEVRAVGEAPLYAGEPGYRADMDGDGDGVACEPHPAR